MATFHIHSGLNKALKLPQTQLLFVGRHKCLKAITFDDVLKEKLVNVDENLFNAALKQLQPESSVPIYLDLAKVNFFFFYDLTYL